MKVVHFHAENFKRLGVVEISPEGNVITVGGKNGHGKSSVLDAIYVALKGRAVAPPMPVRKGEEKATIRLDLGDLIVHRTFTVKGGDTFTDTLKVENSDGLRYQKPQDVLNALLGEVGFDPFEFVQLKPDKQAARLLEMVPLSIDLDEFAEKDASDYENRRDVNRDIAALKAQVAAIPFEEAPDNAPDRDALADQLTNAADTNAGINREEMRRENERNRIAGGREQIQGYRDTAARLRAEADEADAKAKELTGKVDEAEKVLNELPALDPLVDAESIRQQLREAEATIAIIERQKRRAGLVTELKEAEDKAQGFTDAMAARAKERNEALAEAEMPVEGLAFALNEKGAPVLMYEGLPFDKDQISTAAQLRVSTAIGMAANPSLRVLRIKDGSLLDEDSMALLAEIVRENDFQLWVEVVGTGGSGIIMEDGAVQGAPEAEAKPKAKAKAEPDAKADGALL